MPTPMPNVVVPVAASSHCVALQTSYERIPMNGIARYRNQRWTFWRISGNDRSPRYVERGSPTAHDGGSAQNPL